MKVTLREQVYIETDNKEIRTELKMILDKPNPDFSKMKRMGYPTHGIPPRIKMYSMDGDTMVIPRGAITYLKKFIKKYDVKGVDFQDKRTVVDEIEMSTKDLIPFEYQTEAVSHMLKRQQGMVVASCGAGKSIMGVMLMGHLKKPTIIVVHTLELFKQWEDVVNKFLEFPGTVGKIGGGKKTFGHVTIAMIQTLYKLKEPDWKKIQEKFEIFIGDECHHFGANTYMSIMKKITAKYSIGVTATPERKDKKDFIIHAYLGNVIYEVTDEDLADEGRSLTCKVRVCETGRRYNYTKMNEIMTVLSGVMGKDMSRNRLIVDNIKEDLDDDRTVMVLVDRVAHGRILHAMLKDEYLSTEIINGSVDPDTRTKIKNRMIDGKVQVLVANKAIAAEGLDIPIIDSVHIGFWTSNVALMKQMMGRGRRPFKEKENCRVWMYRDIVYKLELDNKTFQETQKEVPSFKYAFNRTTNWVKDQGFDIRTIKPKTGFEKYDVT